LDYSIRTVENKDGEAVVNIFNYFVRNSFAAYPDKEVGIEFFERLCDLTAGYAFYVVEIKGDVTGFGLIRAYHHSDAFRHTAELTYFLLPEYTRKWIGENLLKILTEKARALGIKILLASISSENEMSINFHIKNGFTKCGIMKGIGKKKGRFFDVVWMQKFI
jgi:L-amino acid N-acyltransferase YncA